MSDPAPPDAPEAGHLDRLPLLPFLDRRLVTAPGLLPLEAADWLHRDASFAQQMALRDRLLAGRGAEVLALRPEGEAAAAELRDLVLAALAADPGYRIGADGITRPDGVAVARALPPLHLLGRLVQEDFCLMRHDPATGEHRLAGGVLCFPSRWTLAEKMARGLDGIHAPVPMYPGELARRVQRIFDAIRPDRPLWRANWLVHDRPELFQPAAETTKRPRDFGVPRLWLRVERQTLRRLPETGAVAFSIRTLVAPLESLAPAEAEGLAAAIRALPATEFAYKGGERLLARLAAMFPAPAG